MKSKKYPSAIPIFSTDTEDEADMLIGLFGRLQYDGEYVWTDFSGEINDLPDITRKCRVAYQRLKEIDDAFQG